MSLGDCPGCSSANRNPENLLAKGVWWKAGVRRSYVVSQGTTEVCQEHEKTARPDSAASPILVGAFRAMTQ